MHFTFFCSAMMAFLKTAVREGTPIPVFQRPMIERSSRAHGGSDSLRSPIEIDRGPPSSPVEEFRTATSPHSTRLNSNNTQLLLHCVPYDSGETESVIYLETLF